MTSPRIWRRPTLEAVAARAGVSTATVSNALNGTGRLSEATRQRVPAAAGELGYAPSSTARAVARGGTGVRLVQPVLTPRRSTRRPAAGPRARAQAR